MNLSKYFGDILMNPCAEMTYQVNLIHGPQPTPLPHWGRRGQAKPARLTTRWSMLPAFRNLPCLYITSSSQIHNQSSPNSCLIHFRHRARLQNYIFEVSSP